QRLVRHVELEACAARRRLDRSGREAAAIATNRGAQRNGGRLPRAGDRKAAVYGRLDNTFRLHETSKHMGAALPVSGGAEYTDSIGTSHPLSGQYKGLRGGDQLQAVCTKRQKARVRSQACFPLHDENLIGNACANEGPGRGGAALDQEARDAFSREPHEDKTD